MAGLVARVSPQDAFPFFNLDIHWPSLLIANTPTGGDMGAHVVLPQVLRDSLIPSGRLLGWSNDWYAGYPVFYFYFPLPAVFTVLMDVLVPYGVAFKLSTIIGLVAMPAAAYYLVRAIGFARPVAAIAAAFGSMFVFMESFSIFGANIKSTLAGEFSFSWSFALSLVYLGMVIRDSREGRGFTPAAAGVLALTALSHIVTTLIVVLVSLPVFLRRRGAANVVWSWILGFAMAAFWGLPVLIRITGGLTTDMGWTPLTGIRGAGISNVGTPFTNEFIPIFALGIIGAVWSLLRSEDIRVLLTMTIAPFLGYLLIAEQGWTILYNARLLPYWFMGVFLFAGIAVGLGSMRLARWLPNRHENIVSIGLLVVALTLAVTIIGIHDIPGWVNWNYQGYEGKAAYPELSALVSEIDELPEGRVMWEYNKEIQEQYGTPMALMLIPYWSENHETMEGVFFESSLTTPFHFLNQAEMSRSPSQPVRGLTYRTFDLERGIDHSMLYNIEYYVTQTEEMTGEANRLGLQPLVEAEAYSVFALPDSNPVDVARYLPAVYEGEEDFADVALEWYDELDTLDRWIVASGPEEWPDFTELEGPFDLGTALDTDDEVVSDIVIEDHRISFTTTAVGVPHLVKTSYFPNWEATGADGPYRAAPSLMIVVPTAENVSLEFSRTWTENLGMALSLAAFVFVVWWVSRSRSSRRGRTV
ncbi:MAG: hypothetical protein QNL12_05525, partial [Acidimicrobiia bacterium]|nr:hypothetical protein [Acidimicrobiia bacterium]MDX2466753.1 hypothetical protein [Acidimicrobiia bacterium]